MSDNNRESVFYYSRERRLQRASEDVRAMNDGQKKRRGLLYLFGNRGNIFIFICIILIIAMSGLGRFIMARNEGLRLGGNTLALSIVREGEEPVLVLVKRAPRSGEIYVGEVDIIVSIAGDVQNELEAFSHRIIFNPVDSETFTVPIPFQGNDFFVILITSDEQRAVRIQHP